MHHLEKNLLVLESLRKQKSEWEGMAQHVQSVVVAKPTTEGRTKSSNGSNVSTERLGETITTTMKWFQQRRQQHLPES